MASNLVSQSELSHALDSLAWELAQKAADELPPYLRDDELTVDRFCERNKEKMTRADAQSLLDELVEAGKLLKQERRQPQGKKGGRLFAYAAIDGKNRS